MSLRKPQQIVYFNAVMYSSAFAEDPLELITGLWGNPVLVSELFVFDHTTYYEPEMGEKLTKFFISSGILGTPDRLPAYKHKAIEIEARFAVEGRRTINIDPGYLAVEKVIAASTKNFTHRVYIGDSIYGDLQLMRQKGGYTAMPWTYADYVRKEAADFFAKLYSMYQDELVFVK